MAQAAQNQVETHSSRADLEDVRLAVQGDSDAYARLVRRHQATIAQQMWRFTRDPGRHAELVQDVFVNAYTSLESYRAKGPFLHWLWKIAVRTGYAYWRKEKAQLPLDEELVAKLSDDPDDHGAAEAAELVHHVLNRLPPRDRLVLTLFYLEEHSVKEIAEFTGWSRSMVKVQMWRARAKLKKLLQAEGIVEA